MERKYIYKVSVSRFIQSRGEFLNSGFLKLTFCRIESLDSVVLSRVGSWPQCFRNYRDKYYIYPLLQYFKTEIVNDLIYEYVYAVGGQ